jgi:hypothetical protein
VAAAIGGGVASVCMLAFVILETIRCSSAHESGFAAGTYAKRRLCFELLDSAYNEVLEKLGGAKAECRKSSRDRTNRIGEHFVKLEEVIRRAVRRADLEQLDYFLGVGTDVLGELHNVQVMMQSKGISDSREDSTYILGDGDIKIARYEIGSLFVVAAKEMKRAADENIAANEGMISQAISCIRRRIYDSVEQSIKKGDCTTVEMLTQTVWILYRVIVATERGKWFWHDRAMGGLFYVSVVDWLREAKQTGVSEETLKRMRFILHKGIAQWVADALREKDQRLVESLCKQARELVFNNGEINLESGEITESQFVLAGLLIGNASTDCPIHAAVVNLFWKDKWPVIDSTKLTQYFKVINRCCPKNASEYYHFFKPMKMEETDPLIGARGGFAVSSGGEYQIALAFVYIVLMGLGQSMKVEPINFNTSRVAQAIEFFKDTNQLVPFPKRYYDF